MDRWMHKQVSDWVNVASQGHCSGFQTMYKNYSVPFPSEGKPESLPWMWTIGKDSLLTSRMCWKQQWVTSEIQTWKAIASSLLPCLDCSLWRSPVWEYSGSPMERPRGQELSPPTVMEWAPLSFQTTSTLPATSRRNPEPESPDYTTPKFWPSENMT